MAGEQEAGEAKAREAWKMTPKRLCQIVGQLRMYAGELASLKVLGGHLTSKGSGELSRRLNEMATELEDQFDWWP
jgi:hypothetical protein